MDADNRFLPRIETHDGARKMIVVDSWIALRFFAELNNPYRRRHRINRSPSGLGYVRLLETIATKKFRKIEASLTELGPIHGGV